ncbi:ExeM/NucH family extracellular endonuclease [Ornithinicoccus hortensis]|uniref:LTD domain-containing protein n=1 Tax=Ornithinicoccus hortensis TaxID=82346 RepID=A0A542YQY1_9MICO|nr:ExeM/NucH family extracellular endonuclease [Ornithinicoccus hortensis]TQL50334.1 hypothetical protein FB467_1439 [Ornithinicoccus hortensis]
MTRRAATRRTAVLGASSLVLTGLLGTALPATATPTPSAPVAPQAEGLIISEYIEGSGFNKALEIYNGSAAEVDLADYVIQGYQNGSAQVSYTRYPEGTLQPGEVHVVAHADWALGDDLVDQTLDLQFNGDDAVVLATAGEDGVVVDSIGQVGVDPGTRWGTPPETTMDATLVRNPDVCAGDVVPDDAFDPATEWTGLPTNDVSDLGHHTAECGPAGPVDVVLNEFSVSTVGADLEFLEVYGEADTDYSDLTILEVEGDADSSSRGTVVSQHAVGSTDADGFWSEDLPVNTIQNGTLTLLLVSGYTGEAVLDADQDGEIDAPAWDELLDSVAVNGSATGDLVYSETVLAVEYDGADFAPGGASRIPDGTDTDTTADWVRNDYDLAGFPGFDGPPVDGQAWNTPGAPNEVYHAEEPPPGGACGEPATAVGAVQGEDDSTPLDGQQVDIEGTVVGDFQTGGFQGFYVQDGGDDNPATSDGIFVYAPGGTDVAMGDSVRVSGTAGENFGMTQVSAGTITVCATGGELPEPTVLELPIEDHEPYEGMYVTFPQDLAILEYFNYGRFGEIAIGTDRQYQPTATYEPGSPEAVALAEANLANRITLDDGRSTQNPDPAIHPNGEEFTLDNLFRGGDLVTGATGVLDYRFDLWRIQPTQGAEFTVANPRPTLPDVGGDLTVASFNVLNYFTTLNDRGANTPEEFERQEAKIVAALAEMDADVVGLIEIENNDDVALETLTQALNDEVGAGTYEFVATGKVGTDAITTAFIYQPDSVTPVGDFATLTTEDDPRFLDDFNRPTLAQTFQDNATGESVVVAVNHLKSKGSDCLAVGDPEDPDGQGNCNGVRTDAAEAMADWLAGDPTGTGVAETLIIGDLNSYDKEDPIVALESAGFTDLLLEHSGEDAYSYVFDGQLGYLDHALANEALAGKVADTTVWTINADEASLIDYDMTFKLPPQQELFAPDPFRSSDHDPVLIGLSLAQDPEPVVVDRIRGADRYETSAEIVGSYGDVDTLVLASGQAFPDALSGGAPAIRDDQPVLLTRTDWLEQSTADALTAAAPERIIVLGGGSAVSDTVVEEVEALTGAQITRVSGPDRYATAAEVAAQLFDAADVDTVYVASGQDYADALAGAPLAGRDGYPILLVRETEAPDSTQEALEGLSPERIVVLGGTNRISDTVLEQLAPYANSVERLSGPTRYETAALIAAEFEPTGAEFVASGLAFPDALSGAALVGHLGGPLLLTNPAELPGATADALVEREPGSVTLFGGTAAISTAVEEAIAALFE